MDEGWELGLPGGVANAWDSLTGSLILSQVFHSVGGWEVKVMHS